MNTVLKSALQAALVAAPPTVQATLVPRLTNKERTGLYHGSAHAIERDGRIIVAFRHN